ncbi:aldo/keto reductase [Streptomyces sp. NPDC002055]|uniref:aldo/keto reductase n=1 Tax=Streptomyces sp. NPDC002055 TaxID=3154534 RepID=UPI0033274064
MIAKLGAGTYRCRSVGSSVSAALAAGVGWIDTAPNYAQGAAEAHLQLVLDAHPQVGVSTKVGFVPPSDRQAAYAAGVLPSGGNERHCLNRSYAAWQLARSVARLGRAPQLVFVHNPEHGARDRKSLLWVLSDVFEELESAADSGLVAGYGVATWSGLSSGLFTVSELTEVAVKVGGPQHRLRAVQFPLSLVHLSVVAEALDGRGSLCEAQEAGLDVFASAPFGGGALIELMTTELVRLIAPSASAAQAALMVALSAPHVSRVLVSASSPAHWADAVSAAARAPLSPSHLRKVIDVLGT